MNFFVRNKFSFVISVFTCIFLIKCEKFVFQGERSQEKSQLRGLTTPGRGLQVFKGIECLKMGKGVLEGGIGTPQTNCIIVDITCKFHILIYEKLVYICVHIEEEGMAGDTLNVYAHLI